jgi:membrane protease YdiL (CAAX protease family)
MSAPVGNDASSRTAKLANRFGLGEVIAGLLAGIILSQLAIGIYDSLAHRHASANSFGDDIASLIGVWVALIGAVVVAVLPRRITNVFNSCKVYFGLRFSWADVPLGIAVGIGFQFVAAPLLELPLYPFVPHLSHRLGEPARNLTNHVHGGGLVVLAIFVCLGSPLVEELFFRGLLFRSLLGRLGGRRFGVGASVLSTGVLFGLYHFEALQLIALAGFGAALAYLAWRTERLGPGIVAHMAFNSTTFIALAYHH